MSTAARWGWRAVGLVGVFALLLTAALLLQLEPHPGRLALWTLLLGASSILVLDTVSEPPRRWHAGGGAGPGHDGRDRHDWRGHDDRTAAYLRLLAVHLAARRPDDVLARRLAGLTEQTLRSRHGVGLDAPEAPALLGPDLVRLLAAPPPRMDHHDVAHWLERIEDL